MRKALLPAILLLFLALQSPAQLFINGGTFFIDVGAVVSVQGDVTSNIDITGTGKLLLNGTAAQNLNMGSHTIPNLEVNNTNNAVLTGACRIGSTMVFTNGKVWAGNYNFLLGASATVTGAGAGKFVTTNGTGFCQKEVTADFAALILPVGVGADYLPVSLTNSGSTYSSAIVGARALSSAYPTPIRPVRTESYLTAYWKVTKSGVTGGTLSGTATYVDSRITGTEADLRAMSYNGTTWSLTGGSQNNGANTITATLGAASTDLYAMNRFLLIRPKTFLQGAYNSGTGLMSDLLRNGSGAYTPGTVPASNVVPTTDPYRSAPYNTTFTHVSNAVAETVTAQAFQDKNVADSNVVDWVFCELRNPGSTVVQTRAALVLSNGAIVDIDGVSPLYFKNVDAGSYTIAVRHRNHLGISSNPANPVALSLTAANYDFTTSATLNGTPGVAYTVINAKNVMWGGNANSNTVTNYSGLNNDRIYVLNTLLGGNPIATITNTYSAGDVSMNRTVSYSGLNNDRIFILNSVIGGNALGSQTQQLP